MNKYIAIFALLFGSVVYAADDECTAPFLSPDNPQAMPRSCVSVSTFTAIPAGEVMERSVDVRAARAVLRGITVTSTDCTNCDVTVVDTSCVVAGGVCTAGNTGPSMIFYSDSLVAVTLDSVAYSQYLDRDPERVVTPTLVTGGERRIYVRILNNDGDASTAIVTLVWDM